VLDFINKENYGDCDLQYLEYFRTFGDKRLLYKEASTHTGTWLAFS
jgi:hypothetical protein